MEAVKRAIVTGPTGAVGTALIAELLANGAEVTAVCRPHSARRDAIPQDERVRIVACELRELPKLAEQLTGRYDAFFHLGWMGPFGADRNNMALQEENISCTLDAVRLAAALGCEVFVGAGSQSEFGHIEGVLRPELACWPDNGYGAAKLSAGYMSRVLCRQLGLRHVWCRLLSVYGPRDGQYTLVMGTLQKLLSGQRPQFTKGDQVWDFLYSGDAARAFRLAAEKGRDGAVYCLGSGETRTLRAFLTALRDEVAPDAELGFGEVPYYPNQVMHLEADIGSLTADTGFVPEVGFEEGIRRTAAWVRGQENNE